MANLYLHCAVYNRGRKRCKRVRRSGCVSKGSWSSSCSSRNLSRLFSPHSGGSASKTYVRTCHQTQDHCRLNWIAISAQISHFRTDCSSYTRENRPLLALIDCEINRSDCPPGGWDLSITATELFLRTYVYIIRFATLNQSSSHDRDRFPCKAPLLHMKRPVIK